MRLARAQGYECVLGCAYPHDPMRVPAWYIRWLVLKNLRPGTIVILHDGIADLRRSIQALPRILGAGRERDCGLSRLGSYCERGNNRWIQIDELQLGT
jgi:hypothetical protein